MCFDERKIESRARPLPARRIARRTFSVRRAVRSLSLDIALILLLLANLAACDQAAQHPVRRIGRAVFCSGTALECDPRQHPPCAACFGANDDRIFGLWQTQELGRAHFFFPTLRKMNSPACLM